MLGHSMRTVVSLSIDEPSRIPDLSYMNMLPARCWDLRAFSICTHRPSKFIF